MAPTFLLGTCWLVLPFSEVGDNGGEPDQQFLGASVLPRASLHLQIP